jgi:hypothetical protein
MALGLVGCATPRVNFCAAPPPRRYDPIECIEEDRRTLRRHGHDTYYKAVRDRWLRRAHITWDYDTALDARVVLMTPEFRAAYLHEVALVDCLAPADYAKLVALSNEEALRWLDVIVLLDSSRWDWNDLSSPKSVWSITLADDQRRVVAPLERQALGEKPPTMFAFFGDGNAYFVDGSPFTRGWRLRFPVTFPDGTPLLRPDTKRITVRFAGPLGSDQVEWVAR